MRPIKFRAIHRLTKKKWYAEDLVFNDGKWYENRKSFEDDFQLGMSQCVVMQFTGLKDKPGVEIYEGDVLRDSESIVIVKFVDGEFSVDYRTMGGKWRNYDSLFNYLEDYEGEVIGNIYENPELTK